MCGMKKIACFNLGCIDALAQLAMDGTGPLLRFRSPVLLLIRNNKLPLEDTIAHVAAPSLLIRLESTLRHASLFGEGLSVESAVVKLHCVIDRDLSPLQANARCTVLAPLKVRAHKLRGLSVRAIFVDCVHPIELKIMWFELINTPQLPEQRRWDFQL